MGQAGGVIVVGVDGSPQSEKAVDWALEEARGHGDTVVLVHAWQYPSMSVTSFAGDPLPVFGRDDLEKVAEAVLRDAEASAAGRDAGVKVEGRLVEGHPAAALVDAAKDARLLVVGSRGFGGFRGMLLGSISSSVAHHAHCPTVLVP